MTGAAERIAVTAWDQHCTVASEGWGEAAWYPELVEVIDGTVIGDTWMGCDWPTGTAQGFLADYHAHPRATHLILVSTGTGVYADTGRHIRLRAVHVVGADGEAFALIAPLDEPNTAPTPAPSVAGDLYVAMVEALRPDHELDDELAEITRRMDQ